MPNRPGPPPGHEKYSSLLIAAWRSDTAKFERIMSDTNGYNRRDKNDRY